MAQVTMSGEAGFAYISDKAGDAVVSTSGFSQTDGSITISANEDLGGGMKVVAAHTMNLLGRSGGVTEENSSLTIMGGFGAVTLGAVEAGNGIIGLGGAGGVGRGLDGVVIDGGTNVDLAKYTSPALIPGLTASVSRFDSAGAVGAGRGTLRGTGYGLNYSAGPLSVAIDTTGYQHDGAQADAKINDRQRLSASYDLGVAKVGFGYQVKDYQAAGADNKQTIVGVAVPMGAFTFSLSHATEKSDGAGELKTKGTDVGVNYALSKRTSLNFSHMSAKEGTAKADKYTRLRLKTTF